MSLAPGTQRTLLLAAAWIFGVFLIVAAVFRGADGSQGTLSVVAGVFAYVFIAVAAVILFRGWRRRGADAAGVATRYVGERPAVAAAVGSPVEMGTPDGEIPTGTGAAQANLVVPVSGPAGSGQVDLVMARIARDWEVLSATLVVDGGRVRLAEGRAEGAGDDD